MLGKTLFRENAAFFIPPFITALAFITVLASLSCGGGQKKGAKKGPPVMFVLTCEDGKAIREHRLRKNDALLEKGPVTLKPRSVKCAQAKGYAEAVLRRYKRNGVWEEYYRGTTKVLSRGVYKNNRREGEFKYFNKEGERSKIVEYKKGKKHGKEISYFAGTNNWRIQGQNEKGKKVGLWRKKSNRAGDCVTEGRYDRNYKTGPWTECGHDAQAKKHFVKFRGSYSQGARSGTGKLFYSNGQVLAQGSFVLDQKCIQKEIFASTRAEKCGKRAGRWVTFHARGRKSAEGRYDSRNGLKTGRWVEYYQSGRKMAEGDRKHVRIGLWTFWGQSGEVIGKFRFKGSDVFIRSGTVYRNGQKVAEALPGEGCRSRYNRYRKKNITSCRVKPGSFLSALAKYDPKSDAMKFSFTMMQGRWAFYRNGEKSAEGSCMAGRRSGVWRVKEGGSWTSKSYSAMGPRC